MTKRKAQNDPHDDSTGNILTESNEDNTQPSYRRLNPTPTKTRRTDENYDPNDRKTNKKNEKFKKISSTFSDLSQIGDLATQFKPDRKSNIILGGKAGFIDQISLKHFKCHNYLEFKFHPYINFILGRNGSGKSAVMDAIVLCLGGRTQATGRQAGAKTFIKTNFDKAELSVTLLNEGDDAYKPDVYGSRITVERKINKDGQSQYRILNEMNKLVSNKKSELDNLVEQFNIQVDNPVCFLNQETSKHFLNSSNKHDKYKLFMKASQLESMKLLQELIEKERQAAETLIDDKKSYMPKLEEELFTWEEKYKRCQSVDKLKKNQHLLMSEYSWAFVISWEKIMDNTQKDKRTLVKSKEKHMEKLSEAEESFERNNKDFEEIKGSISELTKTIKASSVKQDDLANKVKNTGSSFRLKESERKKYNTILEKKTKDKNQLSEKLEEEKKNSQNNYDHERIQKEQKIAEIKEKIREINNSEKAKINDNRMFTDAIEHTQKLVDDKNFEIQNINNLIRNNESDIDRLKNSSRDQLLRFGSFMVELVNEVKRTYEAKRFKQMPIGPIGMFIEPKNKQWALAIEQCIGSVWMTAFICGNHQDEAVLHQLINRHVNQVHLRPRVVVTDFNAKLYDYNKYRPDYTEYSTVYEMLNIKDKVVANTLFDVRRIESILLLPNINVGEEVIQRNSNQNCSEAFLPNGDRLLGLPTYRVYCSQQRQARYFCENTKSMIEEKQREIEKFKDELVKKRTDLKDIEEQCLKNRRLKAQNDKQLEAMRREIFSLNNKLKDAENINIPEPADLLFYEEEINKLVKEIDEIKPNLESIEENLVKLKEEYETAQNEKNKYDKEMKVYHDKIDELKTGFHSIEEERTSSKSNVDYYKKLLNEVVEKESKIDQQISHQETELNKLMNAAEQLCPRINTKRTTNVIENEMKAIEKQIQMSVKLHGNEEEITKNYTERRDKFDKIKKDIDKQTKFLNKLKKALKEREHKTHMFTEGKALRCSIDFSNYLNGRNYKGNLAFDHANMTLDIIVHPNKSKDAKESKDLKSLSGGERSYSTVAFLLALWSIVESPILFLDEFDVFMDQINRNFAMELIVNAAKEKLTGQYVFLTPQEMGSFKPDEFVKMFKMPDPRRAIDLHNNLPEEQEEE